MQKTKKIAFKKRSAILQKIVEDKRAINAFIRGEKAIEELHERGIKFVDPI